MKIILPEKDGVANLDIRRKQTELLLPFKSEFGKFQRGDGMSKKMRDHVIEELDDLKDAIRSGEFRSLVLGVIGTGSDGREKGNAVICLKDGDAESMCELLDVAFSNHKQNDPEAG